MMKVFYRPLCGISVLALGLLVSGTANAADMAPGGCTIAGAVTVGGMLTGDTISSSSSTYQDWNALFGEGAGLLTCDAWNFQADFAHYGHKSNISGKDFSLPEGHFGADVFWRDPNAGDFGVSVSRVTQSFVITDINTWRFGAVGDYFLNDQASLGLGAHYFTGDAHFGKSGKNSSGFEFSVDAKYYVTPDFKLTLDGELLRGKITSGSSNVDTSGFALTAQADYQFSDQGLIGFVGGRLARRTDSSSGSDIHFDDNQIFAGLTFEFNGKPGSLVSHDRSGPINNTSTFLEKLPLL